MPPQHTEGERQVKKCSDLSIYTSTEDFPTLKDIFIIKFFANKLFAIKAIFIVELLFELHLELIFMLHSELVFEWFFEKFSELQAAP